MPFIQTPIPDSMKTTKHSIIPITLLLAVLGTDKLARGISRPERHNQRA
jgi:hypothetical protein